MTAVVTGAAGGIGLAVAQRLAERGEAVVLADLDEERLSDAAATLAAEHPGRIAHLAGDAADAAHIEALIEAGERLAGPVDSYIANAGVFRGFGLQASEDDWSASLEVNLAGAVRAARRLVPGWVDADGGTFVVTASAAGLLTQLGSPTYAVTKHAAVGFAEWLAATYGDRGLRVCCLCPMGVRTDMLAAGSAAREAEARLGMRSVTTAGSTLEPLDVADILFEALDAGRFLALPHPEVATMFARKAGDHDGWLAGMQRFRRSLED